MAGREDGFRHPEVTGTDAAWAQELLDQLRPTGRDVRRVVAWLADAVRGEASLQDGAGVLLGGSPVRLDADRDAGLVADIVAGRIASAAWEGRAGTCGWSGWSGRPRPRPAFSRWRARRRSTGGRPTS